MKKASQPPTQKILRERLLRRIRDAKFPADTKNFQLKELEDAGLVSITCRGNWDSYTFLLNSLLNTQTKELKKTVKRLLAKIAILEDYHSPIWDKVWAEPCPIKQAEFRRQAEDEDIRVNEQRRKDRDPFTAYLAFTRNNPNRAWQNRDSGRSYFLLQPSLWHAPMTIMQLHDATGLSRRTVLNILRRANAVPVAARTGPNEPDHYGKEANLLVLRTWLTKYLKERPSRKAWLAEPSCIAKGRLRMITTGSWRDCNQPSKVSALKKKISAATWMRAGQYCTLFLNPPMSSLPV